jgi:hypothetical protein
VSNPGSKRYAADTWAQNTSRASVTGKRKSLARDRWWMDLEITDCDFKMEDRKRMTFKVTNCDLKAEVPESGGPG